METQQPMTPTEIIKETMDSLAKSHPDEFYNFETTTKGCHNWVPAWIVAFEKYAQQQVAIAVAEKEKSIKWYKEELNRKQMAYELVLSQMDKQHKDMYYENKTLKEKIAVFESTLTQKDERIYELEKARLAITERENELRKDLFELANKVKVLESTLENSILRDEAAEKMAQVLKRINNMFPDTGREGCTYGDTQYDSVSAVYGYNLALQQVHETCAYVLTAWNAVKEGGEE